MREAQSRKSNVRTQAAILWGSKKYELGIRKIRNPVSYFIILTSFFFVVTGQAEPRGWLGIYHNELDQAMLIALGVPHGVIIKEITNGSPAEKAGLKVGDVLLKVDSDDVLTTEDLADYVGGRPEQTVRLTYLRQGKTDTMTLTLGTRDRQLELTMENLPQLKEATQQIRPMVRNMIQEYMDEMRALRDQLKELRKEIERLRKEFRKTKEK